MIRFKLTEPPPRTPFNGFVPRIAFVKVRTTKLWEWAPVEFEGDEHLVRLLEENVLFASQADVRDGIPHVLAQNLARGLYGDGVLKPYRAELIEGAEILAQED